jgi:hypothetical protein
VDKFLEENVCKGYIQLSQSPFAAPVFFVKKKDGKLCFIQDYRWLNKWTVKDWYLLLLSTDIINQLVGAKFFSQNLMSDGTSTIFASKRVTNGRWHLQPIGAYSSR